MSSTESNRHYRAQSNVLQMLDFWANAVKIKKWLGFNILRDIFDKQSPQSVAYDLRKSICDWAERKSIIFIHWSDGNAKQIEGPEVDLVLKYFEDNKSNFFTLDLNNDLYTLIIQARGQNLISENQNLVSENQNPENQNQNLVSENQNLINENGNTNIGTQGKIPNQFDGRDEVALGFDGQIFRISEKKIEETLPQKAEFGQNLGSKDVATLETLYDTFGRISSENIKLDNILDDQSLSFMKKSSEAFNLMETSKASPLSAENSLAEPTIDIDSIDQKKINKIVKDCSFVIKLDNVNNSDFKRILVHPDPKTKRTIEGISESEVCDPSVTQEKKLLEDLFEPGALRLAKKQKDWLLRFLEDKTRPKGSNLAKRQILALFTAKLTATSKNKPSEIMEIKFDEILDEIETKGFEIDVVCMNFIEAVDFIKKTLVISITRQEERIDQDFENLVKNYSDSKEYFIKKKDRIDEAVNTLMVSTGGSDILSEKYEKMFLDEVYEHKLDINIPAYFECLNRYKKLMMINDAKLDLRLLLKLAKEDITDEDLRQLQLFGYKSGDLSVGNINNKISVTPNKNPTLMKKDSLMKERERQPNGTPYKTKSSPKR